MTENLPPLALGFLSDLSDTALFVIRLLVAVVGAVLTLYISSPVFKGLYRVIVRRPIPGPALAVLRVGAAVGVGVLLFHFVTFGSGGGGTGGGRGSGKGPGSGGGEGTDKGKGGGTKEVKPPEDRKPSPADTLRIEIIVSKRYKGDGRWYLIDSRPPPKTLDEVDEYLKGHKGKYQNMDIILYANSVEPEASAVVQLKELAEKHKLRTYLPKEYWSKENPEPPR